MKPSVRGNEVAVKECFSSKRTFVQSLIAHSGKHPPSSTESTKPSGVSVSVRGTMFPWRMFRFSERNFEIAHHNQRNIHAPIIVC